MTRSNPTPFSTHQSRGFSTQKPPAFSRSIIGRPRPRHRQGSRRGPAAVRIEDVKLLGAAHPVGRNSCTSADAVAFAREVRFRLVGNAHFGVVRRTLAFTGS